MNDISIPYLSHVSITLSSRIDPPGCAMYFTPLLCARSILSPNGKKASEPNATSVSLSRDVYKRQYQHKVIAYQDSPAIYDFIPTGSAAGNRRALNHLISSDKPKIININNDISIDTYLRPGNNTTINLSLIHI